MIRNFFAGINFRESRKLSFIFAQINFSETGKLYKMTNFGPSGTKMVPKISKIKNSHLNFFALSARGLEIPCIVVASMPATVRGKTLAEKYATLVHQLYAEPEKPTVIGSFLDPVMSTDQPSCSSRGKMLNKKTVSANINRDIR